MIGGVELNPGPDNGEEITLRDIWTKLQSLEDIQRDVSNIQISFNIFTKELADLKQRVEDVTAECDILKQDNDMLRDKLDSLENQSRRSNLMFYNVQEGQSETWEETEDTVRDIVTNVMKIKLKKYDIERAHRVGKRGRKDRPIIVKFNNYKKKAEVLSATRQLRDLQIGVAEDYSETVRKKRQQLKEYMGRAKTQGHRAELRFDKLRVDGRLYSLEELQTPRANIASDDRGPRNLTPPPRPRTQEKPGEEEESAEDTANKPPMTSGTPGDLRGWLLPQGPVTRSKATATKKGRPEKV